MVYFDDVKDKIEKYARMPIKYKKEKLEHIELVEVGEGKRLKNEIMTEILSKDIHQFAFLYDNKQFLLIDNL